MHHDVILQKVRITIGLSPRRALVYCVGEENFSKAVEARFRVSLYLPRDSGFGASIGLFSFLV